MHTQTQHILILMLKTLVICYIFTVLNAVQYPNIFQIWNKIIIKLDKNSWLFLIIDPKVISYSTKLILLDSSKQLCIFLCHVTITMFDISHMTQPGFKLQNEYLLSWWHLTPNSDLLFWKLFKSRKVIIWYFSFSNKLANHNQGQPKDSLFNSYYTDV